MSCELIEMKLLAERYRGPGLEQKRLGVSKTEARTLVGDQFCSLVYARGAGCISLSGTSPWEPSHRRRLLTLS